MKYFGKRAGVMSTVALMALILGAQASAQSLREARPPAEFPPASFTGNQYIDSRGCVYVRAGISGSVNWVPRVSRSREQLCGFQPTEVSATTTTVPTVDAPNPLDTPVAGLPARDAAPAQAAPEAPAPVVAAAPTPAPAVRPVPAPAPAQTTRVALPTSTANAINPLTGRPAGAAPVAAASPSPRVITPEVAPSPQPRTITRAEACEGKTGIQPNMVSQRTGQPIDCGGAAPVIAAVAAPAPTPQPTSIAPTQRRFSRAEACAASATPGYQFVSARTGLPLECENSAVVASTAPTAPLGTVVGRPQIAYSNPLDRPAGGLVAPQSGSRVAAASPYSNPLDGPTGSTTFTPNVNTQLASTCAFGAMGTVGGLPVRCGPQAQSPSGGGVLATTQRAQATRTQPSQQRPQQTIAALLGQQPAPLSNPPGTVFRVPPPPSGYERVWNDGRLNTQRGLPSQRVTAAPTRTVSYATQPRVTPATQPRVTSAPQTTVRVTAPASPAPRVEAISGHRYVQVATFSSRDQAQAAARALRSRGLPMRVGVYQSGGREMRMVLAGPFGSERQLQSALGTARNAGFGGAFTRR